MSLFKFAFLCGACGLRKIFLKYIFIRILTPIFSFKISRKTPTATRISVHYHTTPSSSSSSSYTIIQQSSCYQECRCTDAPSPWWTPTRIGWAPRPRIPHFRYRTSIVLTLLRWVAEFWTAPHLAAPAPWRSSHFGGRKAENFHSQNLIIWNFL